MREDLVVVKCASNWCKKTDARRNMIHVKRIGANIQYSYDDGYVCKKCAKFWFNKFLKRGNNQMSFEWGIGGSNE